MQRFTVLFLALTWVGPAVFARGQEPAPPLASVTIKKADDDANAHLLIAEVALQRGDPHIAAREYANAARLSSNPDLAEQATKVAFDNDQYTIAADSARRWLELTAANPVPARRYLAVIALRRYTVDEALRQYSELLKTAYPTPAAGFADLTTTLGAEEESHAVLSVLRDLASQHSRLAEAQYAVGAAALRAYNYSLAVESARRALDLNPQLVEAERLLGRALIVNGKTEEGLKIARARLARLEQAKPAETKTAEAQAGETKAGETKSDTTASPPTDTGKTPDPALEKLEARLEMAVLYAAAGDAPAARIELTSLLGVPEARAEALRTLASFELGEGKLEDAARHFTELLTTGRHVNLAFYSLGAIHERQRDLLKAVRYYSRVGGGPYASDAKLRAARLLVGSGARDQANALLENYVAEQPQAYADIMIGRARLLTDEGDADAALQLIDDAMRRYPDAEQLRYARSITLERAGRIDEAIAELRSVMERRPGDPVAMNALGYTLAEHNRTLRQAEDLVRKALEKTPDNPAVQDSLGWTLHRLGKNQEALKWLERAYGAEQDAEIAAHIGEVYWGLGRRIRAREVWQAALAVEPDHRYLLNTVRRYPE